MNTNQRQLMSKRIFTSRGFWENGTIIIRIIAGVIITRFGWQVFDEEGMKGYAGWLGDLNFPAPQAMAYLGKWAELIGGISLVLGFMTRWLMIPLIITMGMIVFVMGKADPMGDDQHPFLLLLIFLFYCLAGPGPWSLDHLLFDRKKINIDQKPAYANTDSVSR